MVKRAMAAMGAAVLLLAGCFVANTDGKGRSCQTPADCPKDFYACVPTGVGDARVCEVIYPPPLVVAPPGDGGSGGGAGDGGGGGGGGGNGPVYFCDLKTLINPSCVSTCHGADTTGSGNTTFRLDSYDDVGSVLGAKSKADRVKVRVADGTMPPPGHPETPNATQRAQIVKWVDDGALLSANGQPCDAQPPTPDAGETPVAFAQVQTVFTTHCSTACHLKDNPDGNLDLRAGVACNNIKGVAARCGGARSRVAAGNHLNSELWLMIDNNAAKSAGCGTMPVGVQNGLRGLNNADFQLVTRWIDEGANCQ